MGVIVVIAVVSGVLFVVGIVEVVVICVVAVVVVITSSQLEGSFSSGGLLGPDLHPWQGSLTGGHTEWRRHPLGEDE